MMKTDPSRQSDERVIFQSKLKQCISDGRHGDLMHYSDLIHHRDLVHQPWCPAEKPCRLYGKEVILCGL